MAKPEEEEPDYLFPTRERLYRLERYYRRRVSHHAYYHEVCRKRVNRALIATLAVTLILGIIWLRAGLLYAAICSPSLGWSVFLLVINYVGANYHKDFKKGFEEVEESFSNLALQLEREMTPFNTREEAERFRVNNLLDLPIVETAVVEVVPQGDRT